MKTILKVSVVFGRRSETISALWSTPMALIHIHVQGAWPDSCRSTDLYWLEEPVLSDDIESYLALKKEFPLLPFAWGENGFSVEVYQEFVDRGAVDVVMPDPSRCGGLTQTIRLCETAWRKGIPFSPHHYGSDLGFAGALHLVASQPNFTIMLRDVSDCPLRDEIIEEPFTVTGGTVAIPNKPGLGVELNQKMVERYLVKE